MNDIHARVPINRIAARVTSGGSAYNPLKSVKNYDTDLPIQTRQSTPIERRASGFIELSGRRVGRLAVIGLASAIPARWVLRCDCGRYTTRTAKAIKNPKNTNDRCEHCRHLAFLKCEEHWRRTGRHVNWSEV